MLQVNKINVCYGDLQVLFGVSLEVKEGEMVALVGPNGAGKTTTLRTILGLLQPKKGSINFQGREIHKMSPKDIVNSGISYVPEERAVFPRMTVMENLDLAAISEEAKNTKDESLAWVFQLFPRLKERRKQIAGTLSGGEQRMLVIGRGLMSQPKLLMLDEPSLGLAPKLVKEIFEVVEQINSEGLTVLLVEQNIRQALELADRGYVLEMGEIAFQGRGEELLKKAHIKKVYLGI